MREPTYFILVALSASEPMHGYAISQRASDLSDGRVKITAGTLYGALDRLEKAGTVVVDREEQVSGRRRRYYRITDQGRGELANEVVRMRAALNANDAVVNSAVIKLAGGLS